MKVAIVGTSHIRTDNECDNIRYFINTILNRYDNKKDTIISGGARGVDSIALEIAEQRGFETYPYKPEKQKKKFFFKRNLQIAQECDELHCISIPYHDQKCYHHDKLQEHEKTAGCWTRNKAEELGKPTQLIVVPKSLLTNQGLQYE